MPGIFVQTVVFGAIATAIGLATDMKSGLIERFRSLPMARSAVLAGRTIADLTRNVFVVLLMVAVGFAVGFRVHTGLLGTDRRAAVAAFFGYALSWIFATIGLWVGDPETAQAAAFPLIAPLVFASSLFVPIESMPSWLQPWAEHQPVSVTATAVRDLMLGGSDTCTTSRSRSRGASGSCWSSRRSRSGGTAAPSEARPRYCQLATMIAAIRFPRRGSRRSPRPRPSASASGSRTAR